MADTAQRSLDKVTSAPVRPGVGGRLRCMAAHRHPNENDLISARTGNYQYNPVWGALIDQLQVR